MNILTKVFEFFSLSSLKMRTIGSPNTTIGGGVFGIVAAALFFKIEEMTGCHFATAFGNIDWGQLFVYGMSQIVGALTTDGDKTITSTTGS
jgi:hypothetical protein